MGGLHYVRGDLLEADVTALVNAVNTVGVMGKGIALQFKRRYPDVFRVYAEACQEGRLRVGELFVTETGELAGPRRIVHFPTKIHWRNPTRAEWIDKGLIKLRSFLVSEKIESIAIPALGCGYGGLRWEDVRSMIEARLAGLDEVRVLVFLPGDVNHRT